MKDMGSSCRIPCVKATLEQQTASEASRLG